MLPISQKWTSFFFLVLLGVALVLGHYHDAPPPAPPLLTNGTYLTPRALPSFKWTTAEQRSFSNEHLKGKYTLLYWGYRQCPTICVPTLQLMAKIKSARPKDPIALVLVNVDPNEQRETLAGFLQSLDPSFVGIIGASNNIVPMAKRLGVYLETDDKNDTHIGHSGQVFLLNPQGEYIALFSPPLSLAPMLNDLDAIIRFEHPLPP